MTSIRLKLTLGAGLLLACGIGILVAANAFFMEPYYASRLKGDFERVRAAMADVAGDPASELAAARSLAAGTGYRIVLADREGLVKVSSVPEFAEGRDFPLPKDQLEFYLARREEILRGGSWFGILDADPRGQSVVQLVAGLPGGRVLVVTQALDRLRRSIAEASPFFLLVGSLVLVLVFAVVLVLSGRLARPILELSGIAQRVASGDLDARWGKERGDELGLLGRSLDAMAASLARNIEGLSEANRGLEREVRAQKDFIAGASHELKTPVGLARGYAEALKLGLYSSDAEREELADVILKEADHLDRLVRDLARLAALEGSPRALEPVDADFAETVAEAASRFEPALREKGARLSLESPGPLPARFDPDRAVQVVDKLLANALRHVPEGGAVELRVSAPGDDLWLEVGNEGEAIPEDVLGRLFEPFYRVDPARSRASGGSGLGLATVRAIAEAHGGGCGVRNAERGPVFWVSWPRGGPRD